MQTCDERGDIKADSVRVGSKELFHGSDTKVINIIWREGGRGGRKRKTEKMLRGETKVTLN